MNLPLTVALFLASAISFADSSNPHSDFSACVESLRQESQARGFEPGRFDAMFDSLEYVPKVIELDRRQPEFSQTFRGYFERRMTEHRITEGRRKLQQHKALLSGLAAEYGVPAQYLVAFWGLETNYGSYLGKMPILDSLATLACDQRRSAFFTDELFAALQLATSPGIANPMTGSWAGAMGNTQFMPSTYRRHAVDGDGDGVIDLWNSIPDALTSAANFLNRLGWQAGERWGREVRLPNGFDLSLAGKAQSHPLSFWQQQGLLSATGSPLPVADMKASLLLPAGVEGPAFLVYDNFDVIMRWNRSEFYALSVGHLADRINGAGRLQQPMPNIPERISIDHIRSLQQQLNDNGFDTGGIDGILGSGTRGAIRRFQEARGLIADGFPRPEVFSALDIKIPIDKEH